MSILIKGMEMPKNCTDCILCVNNWCVINSRLHHIKGAEETTQYCPLIEVPPHGDLIDRYALSKSLDKLCDRICQYSKAQRKVMCSSCPLGDAFIVVEDDAPTIIEAEAKK